MNVKFTIVQFRSEYSHFYDIGHISQVAVNALKSDKSKPSKKSGLKQFLNFLDEDKCTFQPQIN